MDVQALCRLWQNEKKCFPWIDSIVDQDVIAIVGKHQEDHGEGISCKQLYLAHTAPVVTVQRHVKRLIRLGVLRRRQCPTDARVFFLSLTDSAVNSLNKFVGRLQARTAIRTGHRSPISTIDPVSGKQLLPLTRNDERLGNDTLRSSNSVG
jgi:hypothetical protein